MLTMRESWGFASIISEQLARRLMIFASRCAFLVSSAGLISPFAWICLLSSAHAFIKSGSWAVRCSVRIARDDRRWTAHQAFRFNIGGFALL